MASGDKLAIIVSSERLGPSYGLAKEVWLGVNLAVGVVPGNPSLPLPDSLLAHLLSPWDWKVDFDHWSIGDARGAAPHTLVPPNSISTVAPDLTGFTDFRNIYLARLRDDLAQVVTSKKYVWDPTGDADRNQIISPESGPNWHQRLAHLATSPSPLPQLLNLAFILHFPPGALSDAEFVVAPTLTVTGIRLSPQDFDNDTQSNITWTYTVDSDKFPAVAVTQPALKSPAATVYPGAAHDAPPQKIVKKGQKPSLATAVTPLEGPVDPADDWFAHFADRAASGFDLASLLLNVLDNPDAESQRQRAALDQKILVQAFLALTSDLFIASQFSAPDKQTVAKMARASWQTIAPKTDPVPATLAFDFSTWKSVLQLVFSGSSKSAAGALAALDKLDGARANETLALLHVIQSNVSNNDNVGELLLTGWGTVSNKLPEFGAFERFARQQLFGSMQLKKRLQLGIVGQFWSRLTDFQDHSVPDHVNARKNFVAALIGNSGSYVESRFANNSAFSPDLSDPKFVPIKALLQGETANKFAQQFALNVLVPQPTLKGSDDKLYVSPTRAPHPLIIAVDRAAGVKQSSNSDDPLQHSRGVAVFLRPKINDSPWRPLNLSQPVVLDSQTDPAPHCGPTVLAPSRLCYANGIKAGTVIYNAAPIAAKGPLDYLADQAMTAKDTTTVVDPLVEYTYVAAKPGASPGDLLSGKLPALVFGKTYQAFVAVVSNTGALPEVLVDTSARQVDPTRLRGSQPSKIDASSLTEVEYKRRVPVGGVRIVKPSTTTELAEFPEIPTDVIPLSRDPQVSNINANADPAHPIPVLLLADTDFGLPARQSFNFDILAPLVDINTWDRSIADGDSLSRIRSEVWQKYFNDAKNGPRTSGFELIDPAVESIVCVAGDKTFTFPIDSATYQTAQRLSLHITSLPPSQDPDQSPNRIQIAPGTPLRLDIFIVLKQAQLDNFDNIEAVAEARTSDRRIRSFTLFLECATRNLPSGDVLWRKLVVQRSSDKQALWTVRLPLAVNDPYFANIGTVQIQRQAWRWRGRPVTNYDFSNLSGDEASGDVGGQTDKTLALRFWEAEEFGGRRDDDHLVVRTTRAQLKEGDQSNLWASYNEDFSNDPRGTYMRFAVRVVSRYDGLKSSALTIESSTLTNVDSIMRWRRVFVPCRLTTRSQTPKVTMVLPLTEPALPRRWLGTAADATSLRLNRHQPGLLAIISEPWYAIAGLAEELKVEIQSVPPLPDESKPAASTDSGDGSVKKAVTFEAGPDPIITTSPFQLPAGCDAIWSGENSPLIGPVGHTFDNSFEDPLFVSSSFLIRPPDVCGSPHTGTDDATFAWFFVKLRFQRVVRLDRCDPALTGSRSLEARQQSMAGLDGAGPLDSEFTHAHWVQYIPGFSIWETDSNALVDVADYVVSNLQDTSFELASRTNGQPFIAADMERFASFAVVTSSIVDAGGDPHQEAFVGVCRGHGKTWTLIPKSNPTPSFKDLGPRVLVRLIELQLHDKTWFDGITSENQLWNGLFGNPSSHTQDAKARIVRISKAIDSIVASHAVLSLATNTAG